MSLLLRFIFLCMLVMCFLAVVWWGMLSILVRTGSILAANAAEKQAEEAAEKMEAAGSFDKDDVPGLCEYVLLDKKGMVVQTSMTDKELRLALRYYAGKSQKNGRFHITVPFSSEVCILQYQFRMEYAEEALRKKLPNFGLSYSLLFLVLFVVSEGWIIASYTKLFRHSIIPLKKVAGELAAGNLDNEFLRVGIREYDDVLEAVEKLQTALKLSLQEQWDETHARIEQTAALAHDIRTPLTVISGNAQLLAEESEMLSEDQRTCVDAILRNAVSAREYVERLRDLTGAERKKAQEDIWWDGEAFCREIVKDAQDLCGIFGLKLTASESGKVRRVRLNMQEIKRGISNIVQNAVEHTPFGKTVEISFDWEEKMLGIIVTDSGSGFSQKALRHALEPLFTENKSRSCESHIGLGLAIANTVAVGYGGGLNISNTEKGHGRVIFMIAIPEEPISGIDVSLKKPV